MAKTNEAKIENPKHLVERIKQEFQEIVKLQDRLINQLKSQKSVNKKS